MLIYTKEYKYFVKLKNKIIEPILGSKYEFE
jgi:hypothetical protein